MIKGLGTDIIEVGRVEEVIQRHGQRFLDRTFTLKEQEYCRQHKEASRHFAGRFAAKEAIVKALGMGFRGEVDFIEIEILNDELGKPHAYLSPKIAPLIAGASISLSISHCKEYATAVAIIA